MKKIAFFLIVLLFVSKISVCQKSVVSLENQDFILSGFNFYIDTIIDAREEKNCIGYYKNSAYDILHPVFFNKDIVCEFKSLLAFQSIPLSDKTPLILQINKIYFFNYVRDDGNMQFVEMNISFLTKNHGQLYELITFGKTIAYNFKFSKGISKITSSLFNEFQERYDEGKIAPKIISSDSLGINLMRNHKYKANENKQYRRGIYWSFADFSYNTPDTLTQFKCFVDEKNGVVERGKLELKHYDKRLAEMWGYSDGENVFVDLGYDIYPLEKMDSIPAVKFSPPKYGSAALIGGLLFGLAGAIVFYAIEASTTPTEVNAIATDGYTIKKVYCYLDYNSATFKLPDDITNRAIYAENIFCFSRYSKAEKPVELIYNDSVVCKLSPSTYCILYTPSDISKFDIKLKAEDTTVTQTIEPKLFSTDVYMINLKKGKKIIFDHFFADMKDKVLKDIEFGKIIKSCK